MPKWSVALAAVALATPVAADLKVTAPTTVCSCLSTVGLPTGGWKKIYDTYTCLSNYKPLGTGLALNNLAFYVEGRATAVFEAKLVLNVHDKTQATAARVELANAAEALCRAVTGVELPAAARTAIRAGKTASVKAGPSTLKVEREDYPSGKGYELRVVIR